MAENPYFHRTPIRDKKYFFGRATETRKVLSRVAKKQPVSIVGPRRIGKSSLLLHLFDPHVETAHGLGSDYAWVYVDCQRLSGDLAKSDVYREMLKAIEATPGDHIVAYDSQEPMTYLGFEKLLDEITSPGLKIVLLFDEFEAIAGNRRLGEDFFTELRALGQTDRVVYVTTSGETLYDLSYHDKSVLSSPFFNIFSIVRLGFMEPQEIRALIKGLAAMTDFEGFDEDDYAFLGEVAGPHPFYLQVACYHLFEERVKVGNSAAPDYGLVKRQVAEELQDHFRFAWKHLSDGERRALRLIGEGNLDKVETEEMNRLEQKCLVCQGKMFASVLAEFVASKTERVSRVLSPPPVVTPEDLRRLGV